jgi:hypothetical protein
LDAFFFHLNRATRLISPNKLTGLEKGFYMSKREDFGKLVNAQGDISEIISAGRMVDLPDKYYVVFKIE